MNDGVKTFLMLVLLAAMVVVLVISGMWMLAHTVEPYQQQVR